MSSWNKVINKNTKGILFICNYKYSLKAIEEVIRVEKSNLTKLL